MIKRKVDSCWLSGPKAREAVENTLVIGSVNEPARDSVADIGVEEKILAASEVEDTVRRLDEVVEQGGEAVEVFWLLLELVGFTVWWLDVREEDCGCLDQQARDELGTTVRVLARGLAGMDTRWYRTSKGC